MSARRGEYCVIVFDVSRGMQSRIADHSIDPIFLARWSTRAFDAGEMPRRALLQILEAARWAPSAYNAQPWRFVYAMRGTPDFLRLLDVLVPFNAGWAARASALVFLLSDSMHEASDGRLVPAPCHTFDAGAAWAQLALQATRQGYQAHAMAGLDFEAARRALDVPERLHLHVAVAIGRPAPAEVLQEDLRAREVPSGRRPLRELAFEGRLER